MTTFETPHAYYVYQFAYALFGAGASAEAAIADAEQWGADPADVVEFTGVAAPHGDKGGKLCSSRGELCSGDMVLLTGAELVDILGTEQAARLLHHHGMIDRAALDAAIS